MDDKVLINEVLDLILAVEQGDASQVDRARLERLFEDSPAAIVWYLRMVEDSVALRKLVATRAVNCGKSRRNSSSTSAKSAASIRRIPVLRGLAAATLLLAATMVWWWGTRDALTLPANSRSQQFAQIFSVSNVVWAENAKQFQEWSLVKPGDVVRFESGHVSLFLPNGVELRVEGPADLQLVSQDKILAYEGKLAARVGPRAIGFCVETPHANVIDRGTSFGLSVDKNCRTSVVVYDGVVDLDVLGGQAQSRRRLATGEALSVDRDGHLNRITMVQSSDFLEPVRNESSIKAHDRLVASVSDNVQSMKTTKYYRVIPRGFREDCRAYVDRLHEWNGLDERGLPSFLLGGDYVMMFNDDKIAPEIEVAVVLEKPANLYVLIDDRVPPPAWLIKDFVDTRWDIGSDDGWPDQIIDTAVGSGRSIDHVCSIWRREVREPSTVILGALSAEEPAEGLDVEWSMYGIVATPLHLSVAVHAE